MVVICVLLAIKQQIIQQFKVQLATVSESTYRNKEQL